MTASDKKTHRGCAGLSCLELGIISLLLWLGESYLQRGGPPRDFSYHQEHTGCSLGFLNQGGWIYLCIFIDVDRVVHADGLGTEDFTVSLEAVQLEQAGSRQQLWGQERGYLRS